MLYQDVPYRARSRVIARTICSGYSCVCIYRSAACRPEEGTAAAENVSYEATSSYWCSVQMSRVSELTVVPIA